MNRVTLVLACPVRVEFDAGLISIERLAKDSTSSSRFVLRWSTPHVPFYRVTALCYLALFDDDRPTRPTAGHEEPQQDNQIIVA